MRNAFVSTFAFVFLLFVLSPVLSAAEPRAASLETRFAAASSAYEQGINLLVDDPAESHRFLSVSIAEFHEIAASLDGTSAALEFNLGNAYFQRGDLGPAILHYRRAERFAPSLPGLKTNLGLARSRVDTMPQSASDVERSARRINVPDLNGISIAVGVRLVLGLWCIGWMLAVLRITSVVAISRWLFLLPLVMSVLLAGILIHASLKPNVQAGVVLGDDLIARTGPGERSYPPIFARPIPVGTELTIEQQRGDWLYVRFQDGRTAWLPGEGIGQL